MTLLLLTGCAFIPLSDYDDAVGDLRKYGEFPDLGLEVVRRPTLDACAEDFAEVRVASAYAGESLEVVLIVDGARMPSTNVVVVRRDEDTTFRLPVSFGGWAQREHWGVAVEVVHDAGAAESVDLGVLSDETMVGYRDRDGDGRTGGLPVRDCVELSSIEDGDCDDQDPAVFPGAFEVPANAVDEDCDGFERCYVDGDEDGSGSTLLTTGPLSCLGQGVAAAPDDCDDADATVFPGAGEICDGQDNNCDTLLPADEEDADGDGHPQCSDCDDADAFVFPGALERCNGKDDDCDHMVPAIEVDHDGDGSYCDDCDDLDPAVYPSAPERCNGVDDDCDGVVPAIELDGDGDHFVVCGDFLGAGLQGGDCDDHLDQVYPGAAEQCDGLRNDCTASDPDQGAPPFRVLPTANDAQDFVVFSDAMVAATNGGILHVCGDGGLPTEVYEYGSPALLRVVGHGPTRPVLAGSFRIDGRVEMEHLTLSGGPGIGGKGGAVAVLTGGGNFDLRDFLIDCDDGTFTQGGGVWAEAPISLSDGEIRNCTADEGGGVFSDALVDLSELNLIDNQATMGGGGGAMLNGGGSWIGGRVQGNHATANGGGVSIEVGNLEMSGVEVRGNSTGSDGGGLYSNANPSLIDMVVAENTAPSTDAVGGGVYLGPMSVVTASNLQFIGNQATVGGGLRSDGTLSLSGALFTLNTALERGGGLYLETHSMGTVRGTQFTENQSGFGGAGAYVTGTHWQFQDDQFEQNSSVGKGGGLYWEADAGSLDQVVFTGNNGLFGGALSVRSNGLSVGTITAQGNYASQCGGAIWVGERDASVRVVVDNATLLQNSSPDGAQVCVAAGTLSLRNSALASQSMDPSATTIHVEGAFDATSIHVTSSPEDQHALEVFAGGTASCVACSFGAASTANTGALVTDISGLQPQLCCDGASCSTDPSPMHAGCMFPL